MTTIVSAHTLTAAPTEATRLYQAARNASGSPFTVDEAWKGFKRRTTEAAAQQPCNPNSAADQAARAAQHAIATEAAAFMQRILSMTPAEREQAFLRDQQAAHAAQNVAVMAHQAAVEMTRPKFSPAEFLSQLSARGITLSAVKGAIQARPAVLLTSAELETLKGNKAAVLDLLTSAETVA